VGHLDDLVLGGFQRATQSTVIASAHRDTPQLAVDLDQNAAFGDRPVTLDDNVGLVVAEALGRSV
jgi:hypothetical protein